MWFYNEETGNFSVGSVPMKDGEEETGWVQIADRPLPHDDYVFDGVNWVAKVIPIIVPQVLTPRQIRKVLTDSGLRAAVENMVATSTDYDLKDWWEYSLSYERTHPKLIEAAYALSLTDAQIDGLFILGAGL